MATPSLGPLLRQIVEDTMVFFQDNEIVASDDVERPVETVEIETAVAEIYRRRIRSAAEFGELIREMAEFGIEPVPSDFSPPDRDRLSAWHEYLAEPIVLAIGSYLREEYEELAFASDLRAGHVR